MHIRLLRGVVAGALLLGGVLAHDAATAEAPQTVEIGAVLMEGAPPLPGINFTVSERGGETPGRIVAEESGGPARVSLEPGRYQVIARAPEVYAVSDIVVGYEAQQRFNLNLRSGIVELRLIPRVDRPAFNNGVSWDLYTYGKGEDGKRQFIVSVNESTPNLVLREGWYFVVAKRGDRTVRHSIQVTRGITYTYLLVEG